MHLTGISVFLAATFISGERAGTGSLALPQALTQAGIKYHNVRYWSCRLLDLVASNQLQTCPTKSFWVAEHNV